MSENLLNNQKNYDAFKQFLSNWGLAGKSTVEIKDALSTYKAYPNDIRVSSEELSIKHQRIRSILNKHFHGMDIDFFSSYHPGLARWQIGYAEDCKSL